MNGKATQRSHTSPERLANEQFWIKRMETNAVFRKLKQAEHVIDQVATGERLMVILCGPPGVGKTFGPSRRLKRHGVKFEFVRPGSEAGLIDVLRDEREVADPDDESGKKFIREPNHNEVLLFDEMDKLWNSPAAVNIIKLVTNPNADRVLRHDLKLKGDPLRNEPFVVKPRLIFTMNKDMFDLMRFPKEVRDDIKAIRDRETPLVIPDDREAICDYACYLTIVEGMIRNLKRKHPKTGRVMSPPNVEETNDAMRFFVENTWLWREYSPRMLVRIAVERQRSPHNWQELFEDAMDPNSPDRGKPTPDIPRVIVGGDAPPSPKRKRRNEPAKAFAEKPTQTNTLSAQSPKLTWRPWEPA